VLVCDADGDATPTSARVSTASRFDPGLMIRAITNCSNIDEVLHVSSLSTKRVALQRFMGSDENRFNRTREA